MKVYDLGPSKDKFDTLYISSPAIDALRKISHHSIGGSDYYWTISDEYSNELNLIENAIKDGEYAKYKADHYEKQFKELSKQYRKLEKENTELKKMISNFNKAIGEPEIIEDK